MNKKQKKILYRILISAVLLIAAYLLPVRGIWQYAAYFVPYAVIGWDILWRAAVNIAHGQIFDENFLMALATVGAFLTGSCEEGVVVMLFYQIGELFQSCAVAKSRKSIADLMDICPDYANVEQDGMVAQVDPSTVKIGSIVVVKPGEKIPLDGVVTEGTSHLNTAALTGESALRSVQPGDDITSGCVNGEGLLRIRTTKLYDQSTAAKIVELVENASEKKAVAEKFISKFARWYTPCVVIAAALLAVLPPVFVGNWSEWIHRALIFLVISCPCALVISVPLSFFGGIGGASRAGILVKGGNFLETLSKVNTIVFDKTGTLTKGEFSVTATHPCGISEEELLEKVAHAECYSNHPIARSVLDAYGKEPDISRVRDSEEIAGRGVRAYVDETMISAGNGPLMNDVGADWHACHFTGTTVHAAEGSRYLGHLVISDTPKPDAADAIRQLKNAGVQRVVMLTGDSTAAADEMADKLGIDEVHAELLPGDKVSMVENLLASKGRGALAFVGDGINDAPVLARADIGIAMGAFGSDAAIEAADIVLMDDSPSKISLAIRIARKTMRIVHENIVFALAVKLLILLLGALGYAGMWAAVFADVGVSVLAILNAIRALRIPT